MNELCVVKILIIRLVLCSNYPATAVCTSCVCAALQTNRVTRVRKDWKLKISENGGSYVHAKLCRDVQTKRTAFEYWSPDEQKIHYAEPVGSYSCKDLLIIIYNRNRNNNDDDSKNMYTAVTDSRLRIRLTYLLVSDFTGLFWSCVLLDPQCFTRNCNVVDFFSIHIAIDEPVLHLLQAVVIDSFYNLEFYYRNCQQSLAKATAFYDSRA